MTRRFKATLSGFTLIEVIVAVLITIVISVSLILLLVQTDKAEKFERKRVAAIKAASTKMEELRRTLFPALKTVTLSQTMDVNETPTDTTDDIPITMYVKIRSLDGTLLTTPADQSDQNDAVEVEVTVEWVSVHASSNKTHSQTLKTIMTP